MALDELGVLLGLGGGVAAVNGDEGAKPFRFLVEGIEPLFAQKAEADGGDEHPVVAKLRYAAAHLLDGLVHVHEGHERH